MVKLTAQPLWQGLTHVDASTWLAALPPELATDATLIEVAHHAAMVGHDQPALGGISCWQQGVSMADSLLAFKADTSLLAAALLYPAWQYGELDFSELTALFGTDISHLLKGAERMDAVSVLHSTVDKSPAQIENCRKMLLAMATDLRVVLLKLVERLHALRTSASITETARMRLGEEIFAIYAPLANRLGLGQLKWEMEDLAFRAVNPLAYKDIAKQLAQRRIERDDYIAALKTQLESLVTAADIVPFQVSGRAKHIYSIHRKISRKSLSVKDLFDINAFRILLPTIEACYQTLDIVQQHFTMIEHEFDDYIAQPKANGYRSIHTAVVGPGGLPVEIQLRTFDMHQLAELGVAAHWRYKEGGASNHSYETKIAWLRELLSWQGEVEATQNKAQQVLADRIYVLTPQGDIVDLPQGSTPLDFAYYIHTNIGHRCRGAKINDHIVPLSTPLQMGDRIDIITGKQPQPSRDWLNSQLGYITTARARSKILTWFKAQDFDSHVANGKTIVEKELKRLHLSDVSHEELAKGFHFLTLADWYAALGANTSKVTQLTARLQTLVINNQAALELANAPPPTSEARPSWKTPDSGIVIEGVGNLLSQPAKCCTPVPGDPICGYISLRQGVMIHRQDCAIFLANSRAHPSQVLHVYWGEKTGQYPLQLSIEAHDRPGLTRDVTTVIGHHKINLVDMQVRVNITTRIAHLNLTLLINYLHSVSDLLAELERIPQITMVKRKG